MVATRWLAPRPRLVEREVALSTIDPAHDGVRIAHLTDVHCGRMTPESYVRGAVELANRAEPDVIVMTGDYVSWRRSEIRLAQGQLSGLRARAVLVTLGNHDYYVSGRFVAAAMAANGYAVLRNEHRTLHVNGAPLHVVGVDDAVTRRHDVGRAFAGVPAGGTRIALSHCPELLDDLAEAGAHLVLSGHTHAGQINLRGIGERVLRNMGRRYRAGFYQVGGTRLFVSPGIGYSGVRVRIGPGTQPEVTVFTLRAPSP